MPLLLITILPSFLIILFFVKSDKFKEPTSEIIKIFFYGILITIPAFYLNTFLSEVWLNTNLSEGLTSSFFTAAPVEEGLKLSIMYYAVYKMKLENIYYVYVLADYFDTTPMYLAGIRAFTAIPAHAIFGIFMGYFFMKYTFIKKGDNLIFAFLVPFTLHGCYNLFLNSNFYAAIALIVISWIIALRLFSRLKKNQITKRREYEKKL